MQRAMPQSVNARWPAYWTMFAVAGMAVGLGACTTPGAGPQTQRGDPQSIQAEKLAREGNHKEAAAAFETLATQATTAEVRDRLLLRAAQQHLQTGDNDQATALLTRLSPQLPTQDRVARAQIAAELALRAQRPDKALAELNLIPQPLPPDAVTEILGLRARALFGLNRPAAGVMAALDRDKTLKTQAEQRANSG